MPKKTFIQPMIVGTPYWPYTSGGVLLEDNCEGVFEWVGEGTGTDYIVEQSHNHAYMGDYSLHLKTRTTGASAGDYVEAYRAIGLVPPQKMALSLYYMPVSGTAIDRITFYCEHHDGTNFHSARARYSITDNNWKFAKSDGTYQDITGSTQNLWADAWHSFSLLVDFSQDKYITLVSDGAIFDLSEYSTYVSPTSAGEHMRIGITVVTAGTSPVEIYVDYICVNIL